MNELLVWALFFVFYLVFQLLGNKKKPRPSAPLPEGDEEVRTERPDRPATLEDALREIQEALRQPAPKPQQQIPPPEPVKARAPEPVKARPTEPKKTRKPVPTQMGEFRSLERTTFPEDVFERTGKPKAVARRRPSEPAPKTKTTKTAAAIAELAALRAEQDTTERTPFQKELYDTFRSRSELKKAFLIREILGPAPHSRFMERWNKPE